MPESTVVHDTFVLERSYAADLAKVFSFFADPQKKRRWYAASDHHDVDLFEMEIREGGAARTSYRNKDKTAFPGPVLANDGSFQDSVPNRRCVLATSRTLGGRRISSPLLTVEL